MSMHIRVISVGRILVEFSESKKERQPEDQVMVMRRRPTQASLLAIISVIPYIRYEMNRRGR